MGNLEECKGGTLWEKEGTLRTPCGNLVGTFPQGSGLLPQGTEVVGGDLAAFSANTYQGKRKNTASHPPVPAAWECLMEAARAALRSRGLAP